MDVFELASAVNSSGCNISDTAVVDATAAVAVAAAAAAA
eukprot:CAMPEP_0172662354 /NCGR_PEP_ID=MMETSP1074-20121228/5314_1 /TAXON_ID=2916 /ORGANISM="Ceratium fusus, Strain PA161109" /LENGTH=38 /DNA_ID= /DNA_START= /DNA_END= /DNA_ORIENTATION=